MHRLMLTLTRPPQKQENVENTASAEIFEGFYDIYEKFSQDSGHFSE